MEVMKHSYSILVVDDETEIRTIIRNFIQSYVGNIYEADDGESGYELIKSKNIDVIISDIKMKKLNGIDFLRKIRAEGFEQPFILISAHASKENAKTAIKYGAYAVIEKPFTSETLHQTLQRAFIQRTINLDKVHLNEAEMAHIKH